MKKCLILLLVIALMTTLIGCSDKKPNKESVVKSETETGMSNDNIECSFKAVVTEVSENGFLVEPVPGSDELRSSNMFSVSKNAITDSSQPVVGNTYEIVYDGRIMETYPAGLGKISSVTLIPGKKEEGEPEDNGANAQTKGEVNLNSNVGTDNLLDSIIMASSDIDIDEDGRTEYCTITPGPTSGLFTVTITAYRDNAIQYKNTFNLNWGEMKFGEKDGENYLIITRNGELQEYGVEYHKIYVESGRIVIDGLDPKYEGYWGGPDWNYDLK